MNLPRISIITPTYNAEPSIEKNLLSVGNQSYKGVEHILIDGGSEDDTLTILRKYRKLYKHIRFISEKDRGIYDAINKGMELCSGDWIYILGADDEFYNEHILMDLFKERLFNKEQVVYGNVIIKGDTAWADNNTIYDGPFNLEKLFRKNLCHQSIFYPCTVIKKVGYYSDKYTITADWDYNVRCFTKFNFTYIDKIIAIFQGGGKSSKGENRSFYEDMPESIIKYFQIDPYDPVICDMNSPFYYPMARYREAHVKKNHDES